MAGIYIHIPFCKQACHYCNFHFSTTKSLASPMAEAIANEAFLQKNYLNETVDTIYFGGGTPSLLTDVQLEIIWKSLHQHFNISPNAEQTIEANPDDITREKLLFWKQLGINRLSIGVQSFNNADLVWMNRAHDATEAEESIRLAQSFGFENITIDLIYGIPHQSNDAWLQNIKQALALHIPHLSCYALTVENKTALERMIQQNKKENTDPALQAEHFEILLSTLTQAGYEQYEISNFSKPNYRSRHNSNYWLGKYYLGLGPSAHSFNGISRQWNVSNNALYIKSIENQQIPFELEILTPIQKMNEYIMTSLRTIEGLDLDRIEAWGGNSKLQEILEKSSSWLASDKMKHINNYILLTNEGKLFADGIAAHLFFVEK